MTRIVPPLHGNHAPIALQEAFFEAVDAFADWETDRSEPTVRLDDRDVPISSIFGRLRTSEDLLPVKTRMAVEAALPDWDDSADAVTYAVIAARLRELCVDRLRAA